MLLEWAGMAERSWERWDDAGVADTIESYWNGSVLENVHRAVLADLSAEYVTSRDTELLEVGCGTGKVYEQLVPRLLPDERYTGVDVSASMLEIARRKFPQGRFLRGDGYGLAFPDRSFDTAVAFEVLGHLPEVAPFLGELLRVVRRMAIVTVWPCAEGTVDTEESVRGSTFIHRQYSHEWLCGQIEAAAPGQALDLDVAILDGACWGYVLKRRPGEGGLVFRRLLPVSNYRQRLLQELAAAQR